MRIAFVQQLWLEWQAPMLLSAIARQRGHQTLMVIDSHPKRAAARAVNWQADLVAFSVLSGGQWFVRESGAHLKRLASIPVVIGGPHVTLCPEEADDPAVDFACVGEGETMFGQLLDLIDHGGGADGIPGLVRRDGTGIIQNPVGEPVDVDSLPFADRELYYRYRLFRSERTRVFFASRGCDGDCTYCCAPSLRAVSGIRGIRLRDPSLVCAEIRQVRDRWGLRTVFFEDDTFGVDPDWTEELAGRYHAEIGLPFMCMTRASLVTPHLVRILRQTGCVSVQFGIEHGDPDVRRRLLGRRESDAQLIEASRLLREARIMTSTLCMIGVPGESLSSARTTLALSRQVKTDFPWAVPYRPFPNTPLEGEARKRGELGDCDSRDRQQANYYSHMMLDLPDQVQLHNLQRLFSLAVRWPWVASDRVLEQRWLSGIWFLLFAAQSLWRELRLWRRSAVQFVIAGILNQLTYRRLEKRG